MLVLGLLLSSDGRGVRGDTGTRPYRRAAMAQMALDCPSLLRWATRIGLPSDRSRSSLDTGMSDRAGARPAQRSRPVANRAAIATMSSGRTRPRPHEVELLVNTHAPNGFPCRTSRSPPTDDRTRSPLGHCRRRYSPRLERIGQLIRSLDGRPVNGRRPASGRTSP